MDRIIRLLDTLRSDTRFAWRQLGKNRLAFAAAVLSLGLAMGASISAFRIVDGLLLRPLPVADPERLYVLDRESIGADGQPHAYQEFEYPLFREMRTAMSQHADLLAISAAERVDVTYASDAEMEKAQRQYVSGGLFAAFGLGPALGRLLSEDDDVTLGGPPYAVLSHDYWTRRFGRDPRVIGRPVRIGAESYEIIGVVEAPFTGTDTGTFTDLFVPAVMHPCVTRDDCSWFRTWVRPKRGAAIAPLHARLQATVRPWLEQRARTFIGMSGAARARFTRQTLTWRPAAAGVSGLQQDNRRALVALAALVALVLLIACVNVANLMLAQAFARAQEMALRVSMGAKRWRLVQLVLVQSLWLSGCAALLGGFVAVWTAPLVVGLINPPDNPVRLSLPLDGRLFLFGFVLTFGVTCLLGLAPALRASAVTPVVALKGGAGVRTRRGLMHALIGAQVAICVLVLFVSGLFVATFTRLAHRPLGFSAERLLAIDAVAAPAQSAELWSQVGDRLRALPGVGAVALADWPLLTGHYNWTGLVTTDGTAPHERTVAFLGVSRGWLEAMKIPIMKGRDFLDTETSPGAAIVNETFANVYFPGENAIGRSFTKWRETREERGDLRFRIVGVVRDVPYRGLREPTPPTAYVPFASLDPNGVPQARGHGTFIVRTRSDDPLALASMLRHEVAGARPGFRVSHIRTQVALHRAQTIRERLLAMMASFFAVVALLLAGVGLHGVLWYSVLQRTREISIRLALGARAGHITRVVTNTLCLVVLAGAVAGLIAGPVAAHLVETLFYEARATDPAMLVWPCVVVLAMASAATFPALMRALRIDPVLLLRGD